MNVAILRMKNITWQIYAISSIMGTGASLVSFSTTVLLAFDLSIKKIGDFVMPDNMDILGYSYGLCDYI